MIINRKLQTIVLNFLNALHHKNETLLAMSFSPDGVFQDVLPNGTLVKSSSELMKLHKGFIESKMTGFRPFDWQRSRDVEQSTDRNFNEDDLESIIEFESGFFCRIAAEVDRPTDLRMESEVGRYYMYLGILVKNNYIVHIQNTIFDPWVRVPG